MKKTRIIRNHSDAERFIAELLSKFKDVKATAEDIIKRNNKTSLYCCMQSTTKPELDIGFAITFPDKISEETVNDYIEYFESLGFERKPESVYHFSLNEKDPWENGLDLIKDRLRW